MSGYYCPHGYPRGCPCEACVREDPVKIRERRDDEMRQTLIDLTLAFNRMADAVERLCGARQRARP